MTALQLGACAWWAATLVLLIASTIAALVQPLLRRRGATAVPAISVLVPLKADSVGLGVATRSVFAQGLPGVPGRQGLPGFEVIFSAAEERSPAIDRVTEIAAALAPPGTWHVMATMRAPVANPKVANLVQPVAAASNDLLLVKDADTILPPGHVGEMASCLGPGVGLVVSAPVAVAPASFAGEVECAFVNTYGARLLLAASTLGIGVGIGAVMMVRRADLERADGLRLMAASIADDHALAKAMRHIGLSTVMTGATVTQVAGRRHAADVWRRHLRWALCRRMEEPAAFAAEPFAGAAFAALAAVLAAPAFALHPLGAALATLSAWIVAECSLARLRRWPLSLFTPAAILVREAVLPLLWAAALATGRVGWGDGEVAVSPDTDLDATQAKQP